MSRVGKILLAVIAIIVTLLSIPDDAYSYQLTNYRWKYGTVCIINKAGSSWPVKSAAYRWSKVPDLTYNYGGSCTQKVFVYSGWYGSDWHGGRNYGFTECWLYSNRTSGSWEWLGNAYRSYRCTIWLNNSYRPSNWDDRRSVLMHELGHTAGLNHTSANALMNIYKWRDYNYPTYDDKAGVEAQYPW